MRKELVCFFFMKLRCSDLYLIAIIYKIHPFLTLDHVKK